MKVSTTTELSHEVKIFIAGNYDVIEKVCSDYVSDVGLCVNIKRTNFIYTYGEQSGAEIGIIQYPRFPSSLEESRRHAMKLAELIMEEANQRSATVIYNEVSIYIERETDKEK